ncbi:class II aldolase/adducin N-terminal [Sphaerosporella brunnea]|uniref:Methylthioribulose-1-phosphate dehydratase n=1 Tax=Sphaerosporella brunnea TaxID=1250544 RepID=A0A5J5EC18_9PEZI|nr:class II aldolase/adducin N-terminal [Sphaerosporella brunnea]
MSTSNADSLVLSENANHPVNLICSLCRNFYNLGWVTGTGGGISIRERTPDHDHIFIAPSGVQKERLEPANMFVMDFPTQTYLRKPLDLKPSACTPLFMAAFSKRGAGACIHTHSQAAVLCTLLTRGKTWSIANIEQIKAIPRPSAGGYMGFFDTLVIPIIENTAHEEDLKDSLEKAIEEYPDTCAVLVRRHGVYVWGDTVWKAKTQAESLDYLFELGVKMVQLGLDPAGPITPVEE